MFYYCACESGEEKFWRNQSIQVFEYGFLEESIKVYVAYVFQVKCDSS